MSDSVSANPPETSPESPDAPAPVVVAIDGPSGTGKSSTSKAVAARLGLRYLDTGAQYRALTWWMLSNDIDVDDPDAIAAAAAKPAIVSGTDPSAPTISADGADATGPIRTERVTSAVSAVSAVPQVRTLITDLQRSIAVEAEEAGAGIVVEGRDIGTTVLPDADVKIFLTASAEARAARRNGELSGKAGEKGGQPAAGQEASLAATREALARRDQADSSRKTSPLQQAGDAVEVDTTELSLDEVVRSVVSLVQEAATEKGRRSDHDARAVR